ncbi:hypothetical protein DFP74_5292 [Nocardiopsis sp. Huas11]|uniref:AtuA-related protein n=1 Tax=Nocardiopsis sp. Huas11 TaxID=2183912 RepID=UPI000EAE185D|nr:hypothetical protein [Nocardiopsis sp. Huas11]RKS09553.1 hypothetical protein DFP74_5292 [Nocardiopsis sp. Huas11]
MSVRLYDVAHARTGDKGNLNTIALIPYDPAWYPVLCETVTPERVGEYLRERVTGPVTVHRLDRLPALLLVCARACEDTVTTSLYLDTHGKSLGSVLLGLPLEPGAAPWPERG